MRLPDIIGVELNRKPQPGYYRQPILFLRIKLNTLEAQKVVSSYLEFYGEAQNTLH